jgi:hypothetical protein
MEGVAKMKRLMGLIVAAGMALGMSSAAGAAPAAQGLQRTAASVAETAGSMVAEVGYRRGHYRPVYRHRPVQFHRPVYRHRPVYYRPVYRPIYAAPIYRPRHVGPRCVVRYRAVRGWDGYYVRRPVRICRW